MSAKLPAESPQFIVHSLFLLAFPRERFIRHWTRRIYRKSSKVHIQIHTQRQRCARRGIAVPACESAVTCWDARHHLCWAFVEVNVDVNHGFWHCAISLLKFIS